MEIEITFKDGKNNVLIVSAEYLVEMILSKKMVVNGDITLCYNTLLNTWKECTIKPRG